jgi:dihydropteroate synthase
MVDPGYGGGNYGKNTAENYYLLKHQQAFIELGFPLLVGWSRKSMLGDTLNGAPPAERLFASIAAATLAALKGAAILRVHDVKATVDAMKVLERYQQA